MIQWVCELSASAVGRENVYVATDSDVIASLVEDAGYSSVLTNSDCLTGTDRVADAMRILGLSRAINVQGDEPLLDPKLILDVAVMLSSSKSSVINAGALAIDPYESASGSIPKLVLSNSGLLLYASRAQIPGSKNGVTAQSRKIYKQVCVYGFHVDSLDHFGSGSAKTPLEQIEDIEILRFLEWDVPVKILQTDSISIAVDFPDDIAKVERALVSRRGA
jgi:3-deoxy-manno-octulosonate cytidylyltransferase (CMP-KDO synthetase)